ncbi:DUF2242 domain-containing protein [Pseudorhodoferax sp. Leaf267]|uniref:DUF2242 domain-containing protein n=1 Tax=Pseudorhodoferax sp. Leaf267 TaxID=1736316 RepID=UPI0006F1F573|nr:DUF2242 domain-containing protein [Pseudorhodoferax sp. Leaf267]KQP22988.1 hypothetical protein ASF43_03625 [Pseudorhodoferax sp. Leaf267]
MIRTPRRTAIPLLVCLAVLAGCQFPRAPLPPQEQFDSSSTFSRSFGATPTETCEAARRALLSQGYVINAATKDLVHGRKNFQPAMDTHVEMEIRVVCAPETRSGKSTLGFVTAQQDRFALKKSNTAASLGVGAVGSVSLPFSQSDDSLVRIGSETISTEDFYERLFVLINRFLLDEEEEEQQQQGGGRAPHPDAPSFAPFAAPSSSQRG